MDSPARPRATGLRDRCARTGGAIVPTFDPSCHGIGEVHVRRLTFLDLLRHHEEALNDPGQPLDLGVGGRELFRTALSSVMAIADPSRSFIPVSGVRS